MVDALEIVTSLLRFDVSLHAPQFTRSTSRSLRPISSTYTTSSRMGARIALLNSLNFEN